MITSEFIGFIVPQLEPMQMTFFVIILMMFLGVIISTHRNAKIDSWERNWNQNTPDDKSDDLDIEHGSITDLSSAVATKSEKLADVMPGMLLVVGLLGTFLGLGLALNNASNILSQSDPQSAAGAANSMQDLMSMMQGLGTKFKTSTWGIVFFLLLKIWSSWFGYEERRLNWVIRKVKVELEHRKSEKSKIEADRQQALFSTITQVASNVVSGFELNIKKLASLQQSLQNNLVSNVGERMQRIISSMDSSFEGVRDELIKIKDSTRASSDAMAGFVSGTKEIIAEMSQASDKMADGAHQVGIAGSSLVLAVNDFSSKFTEVLGDVQSSLSSAINDMSTQAAETLEKGTKELGLATNQISVALGALSNDVTVTMGDVKTAIEKSLKIQQDGAVLFRNASDTLNENVAATTELVNKLGDDIGNGLKAVSDSGRRMASIGGSLEKVVDQLDVSASMLTVVQTIPTLSSSLIDEAKQLRINLAESDINLINQITRLVEIQDVALLLLKNSSEQQSEQAEIARKWNENFAADVLSRLEALSLVKRDVT